MATEVKHFCDWCGTEVCDTDWKFNYRRDLYSVNSDGYMAQKPIKGELSRKNFVRAIKVSVHAGAVDAPNEGFYASDKDAVVCKGCLRGAVQTALEEIMEKLA